MGYVRKRTDFLQAINYGLQVRALCNAPAIFNALNSLILAFSLGQS
jgi:hypothetical protein